MESTVKTLKINAINIKSVLINGNKNLKKLRVDERSLLGKQQVERKRQQKEAFVESQKTRGSVMGNIGARLMSGPMSLLDKIKEFFGNILLGILVNNLPILYDKITKFLEDNKDIIETIKSVVMGLGNSLVGFVTFVKGVSDNIGNIGKQWNQIGKDLDEMLKSDGPLGLLTQGLTALDGLFRTEFSDFYIQRDPEQVREDVREEVKGAQIPREKFEKRLNEYRKAKTSVNVTQKVIIPGLGTYQRKKGGFFGTQIIEEVKDTYGASIPAQEFDTRFLDVVGNLDSIYQGFSQGGTVRPASSSSGGAFPGESGALKKARASVQTFTIFENNASDQSFIIDSQEENNKRFKVLIDNFKELYDEKSGISTALSSPYKLSSPKHQGPVIPRPAGKAIPGLGRIFGYVGSTGLSTGDHIHIETGDGYAPHDDAAKPIPHSVLDNIIVDGRPLHEYYMNSGVEWREHPVTGEWRLHRGYDYPIRGGAPIQLKGGLKYINFHDAGSSGYGKSIMIQDENGNNYIIGHLSKGPDPASLQPPSGQPPSGGGGGTRGPNITPLKQPGYGKGGLDMLTQFFDGEGMTEVLVINSTQPIIVPGPTRYIRR